MMFIKFFLSSNILSDFKTNSNVIPVEKFVLPIFFLKMVAC